MEWVVLVLLLILWFRHSSSLGRLDRRIQQLTEKNEFQERTIRQLTRRVFELERGGGAIVAPPPPPAVPVPEPLPEPMPEPLVELVAAAVSDPSPAAVVEPLAEPAPAPEPIVLPVDIPPPAKPKIDWEAVIGGNWLNAAGVLILVIGISLFLGYALTQFGPAGKIGIGALVSLAMLAVGVFVEPREKYQVLGRGLIAGGWATLYFTAYAAHALDAARVIDSPVLGMVAMLAVATGMIAHSMRYRSQNLTLLAFFAAFLALQLAPATTLSIAATVPLAVALLTVSRHLGWGNIPVAGLLLTYLTFAFRFRADQLGVTVGAAALYSYWIIFELYDLLKLRAAAARGLAEYTIFPLNALLLLATAAMTLPPTTPIRSSNFLGSLGFLFLTSTILRRKWQPAAYPNDPVWRELATGYRIGIAVAAALFAGSILRRFPGARAQIGLLLEGQLLILAGRRLGESFFCRVGEFVFGGAIVHLIGSAEDSGHWTWGTRRILKWTPMAGVMAIVFYANRWLARAGPQFTWPAAALLMAGSAGLLQNNWIPLVWMMLAAALMEVHVRTRQAEFGYQGLVAGMIAAWGCAFISLQSDALKHWEISAVDGGSAILAWCIAWQLSRVRNDFERFACWAGTVLLAWAMWLWMPAAVVTVAWGLLALGLLEMAGDRVWFRWQAHALAVTAFARVFFSNLTVTTDTAGLSHRVLTVIPLVALAWYFWRQLRDLDSPAERGVARSYSYWAVAMMVALLRFELGRSLAVLGWAVLMVALLWLGIRWGAVDLRRQAYGVAVLTFARSWATNFNSNEHLLMLPERVAVGVFVICAYYAAQFLAPREAQRERGGFAILGTALLSLLLYYEGSGQMLTIFWGAQGVATLVAGFATRERVLRFAGLALFAVCILKLFVYDLRRLETLSYIASFIVLGLVLIGASWLYMRFREQIQRYL